MWRMDRDEDMRDAHGARLTVALHACCGPCLLEPYDALASSHAVRVVFANPNISPREEYERRRDTLFAHAERNGIEAVEVICDPELWSRATRLAGASRAIRCRACYELRLSLTAEQAAAAGCDALATTLAVSPYQDVAAIDEVGAAVAGAAGLKWLGADWRSRYPVATRRSRALGMYRQNHCGCLPSMREAEVARNARRSRR